jgi:hypothetical protein
MEGDPLSYFGDYIGGQVFAVNTDGTAFTTLYRFTGNRRKEFPGGLILSGNTSYGAAIAGVFSLSFQPQLTTLSSGPNLILTWPTNYAGFDYTGYRLETTINLGPSAAWTTNSPAPVVVNGQNTVTNAISGRQQFFRLSL